MSALPATDTRKFGINRAIHQPVRYVAIVTTITTQHGHIVAATDVFGPFDDEWEARQMGAEEAKSAVRGSTPEFGGPQATYSVSRLTQVAEVNS